MKTTKPFWLLAICFSFFQTEVRSEVFHYYVIQLAQYSDAQTFEANQATFNVELGSGDNYVMSEKIGEEVFVYLMDGKNYFVGGDRIQTVLAEVKTVDGFEQAFQRPAPNDYSKLQVVDRNPKAVSVKTAPSEFSTKGNNASKYTIQLGVFSQMKSPEQMAKTFGLTNWEQHNFDRVISQDFTKVENKICRRYFFGSYATEAEAVKQLVKMEQESGETLKIVKL